MPPTDRFVPSFAAEPQQNALPSGRWAYTLREQFLAAAALIDTDEELGEAGEIRFFPDRTYCGRTYVPASTRTSNGFELFGFVSFDAAAADDEDPDFGAEADFTGDVAENNPDWTLDLNSWTIATWRGEQGERAEISLIWGVPLGTSGEIATAELGNLAVDQCPLDLERFTLIAPDSYREEYLDVKLWDARGQQVASESLYDDEDEDEDESADESEGETPEDETVAGDGDASPADADAED